MPALPFMWLDEVIFQEFVFVTPLWRRIDKFHSACGCTRRKGNMTSHKEEGPCATVLINDSVWHVHKHVTVPLSTVILA